MQASDWDASWHLSVEVFLHIQLGGGPREDQVHTGEIISLPKPLHLLNTSVSPLMWLGRGMAAALMNQTQRSHEVMKQTQTRKRVVGF